MNPGKLIREKWLLVRQNRFAGNSMITIVSYAFVALAGISFNILVSTFYSTDGLGIASQALAFYSAVSIAAAFGITDSIVKFVAQYKADLPALANIIVSGLLASLTAALGITAIAYLLAFLLPSVLPNVEVGDILKILLVGLPFFTLNKIFFGVLNGLSEMKKYSLFQLIRWALIIAFVVVACLTKQDIWILMMAYPISEFILFFILLITIFPKIRHMKSSETTFIKTHFRFGSKTVLAGTIGEVNNNVDVLLIGYFLGNSYAGLYSFAASITRGMAIIPGVIQMNFNPVISELYSKGEKTRLSEYTKKVRENSMLIMSVLIGAAAIAYPVLVYYIVPGSHMQDSIPVFYILSAGIFAMTAYSFAGAFFTMAGYPGLQLRVASLLFLYNTVMNSILIWFFGIYGAAIATASSYLFTLLLLRYLIRKKLGITI